MQVLNERCKEELQKMFSSEDSPVEDATIIAIDAIGADVRIRSGSKFGVLRMGFDVVSASAAGHTQKCTLPGLLSVQVVNLLITFVGSSQGRACAPFEVMTLLPLHFVPLCAQGKCRT